MAVTGRIHSFESFGSVDGPGVRFVVFMQGCRMRCRYCHNPDTWKTDDPAAVAASPEEVLDRALRYRAYWGEDGGITVSGGEPLLQLDFVTELFRQARALGVSTVLDTAAGPFEDEPAYLERFDALMAFTDLVMLDIKHIDEEAHRRLTGFANKAPLACARHLDAVGKPVWIRHVLVPGITDDEAALRRLRDFLDTLGNVSRREVLAFHNFARFKWERLGIRYTLGDVEPPDAESLQRAREILGCHP